MKRLSIPLAVLAATLASVALSLGGVSTADATSVTTRPVGFFRVFCSVSHRAPDDPIVHKGMPGMAHSHDFLGSKVVDADVTLAEMSAGGTSCRTAQDKSAYWMPSLLHKGVPVKPADAKGLFAIYYSVHADAVVPPNGLAMLSYGADDRDWDCTMLDARGKDTFTQPSSQIPFCPAGPGASLRMVVEYPDCWDGVNLDSADHRSHLAFSNDRPCPASHPVRIPEVVFSFRYAAAGLNPADLSLASGAGSTSHGDVIWNWDRAVLQANLDALQGS